MSVFPPPFFSRSFKVTSFGVDSGGLKERQCGCRCRFIFSLFFLIRGDGGEQGGGGGWERTKTKRRRRGDRGARTRKGAVVVVVPSIRSFPKTLYIHRQYFLLFLFMIISGVQFVQVTSLCYKYMEHWGALEEVSTTHV